MGERTPILSESVKTADELVPHYGPTSFSVFRPAFIQRTSETDPLAWLWPHLDDAASTSITELPLRLQWAIERALERTAHGTPFEVLHTDDRFPRGPEEIPFAITSLADLDEADASGDLHVSRADHRALAAVRDLCEWLYLPESAVARLCNFSVRSIANWRQGREPRPATVRRLLEVRSTIGALIEARGLDGARALLAATPDVEVSGEVERLMDEGGLAKLSDEIGPQLFESPKRRPLVGAEPEERSIEDDFRIASRRERVRASLQARGGRRRS